MDPVSLILSAASLGGGLMQAFGGRKEISPEWLRQHFGASAVNQEMLDLFNNIINSPVGQRMLASAAQQGQQFGRDVASQAAQAGFGPGGGADSGASIFAGGAAAGAPQALERDVRANIMAEALPLAQQIVHSRMQAFMEGRKEPTRMQMLGGALGEAAGLASMARTAQPAQTGRARVEAPTAGLASALNTAANAPTMLTPRGSLSSTGPVQMNTGAPAGNIYQGPSFWSRLGRRLGRYGGFRMVQPLGG